MDDMNAFERQVAGEFVRRAGPVRPVDAAAILTGITATQSPKWRFPSMFSATKFVVAGAIVALFGGLLLVGVSTQPSEETAPVVGASEAVSPELQPNCAPRGSEAQARPVVTDVIAVGMTLDTGREAPTVVAGDAIWVPGEDGERDVVLRLDPETCAVTDTISVGAAHRGLLPTDDALWVVGGNTVTRIDLAGRTVTDTISVEPNQNWGAVPLIADGSLWGQWGPDLVEIDLATRGIADRYPVPLAEPLAVWLNEIDGSIWLVGEEGGLARFDLDARGFTDAFEEQPVREYWGGFNECCVADEGAIWLVGPDTDAKRFDLETLEVTDTLDIAGILGPGVFAAGAIWLPDDSVVIHRIDPTTREVTDEIVLGQPRSSRQAQPSRPVFADGAVWVSTRSDGTVSRIDVETREVTHAFEVGARPGTPVVFDGAIWVPSEGGIVTRISTNLPGDGSSSAEQAAPDVAARRKEDDMNLRTPIATALAAGLLASPAASTIAQSDDPMAAAEFTGTIRENVALQRQSEGSEDGIVGWTQPDAMSLTMDVTDPRLTGDVVQTVYWRDLPTTRGGYFVSATWEVSNDGGRWVGTSTGFDSELVADDSLVEGSVRVVALTGQDGYEGLSARLVEFGNVGRIAGAIVPGEMAPFPEPYATE